jgi:hypothetical protein
VQMRRERDHTAGSEGGKATYRRRVVVVVVVVVVVAAAAAGLSLGLPDIDCHRDTKLV